MLVADGEVGVSVGAKAAEVVLVAVGISLGVGVGVLVMVGVSDGVVEGVSVFVTVIVRLDVGVLTSPIFLLLKEIMIIPRRIARMAMDPIMVLDFIMHSRHIKELPESRYHARYQSS